MDQRPYFKQGCYKHHRLPNELHLPPKIRKMGRLVLVCCSSTFFFLFLRDGSINNIRLQRLLIRVVKGRVRTILALTWPGHIIFIVITIAIHINLSDSLIYYALNTKISFFSLLQLYSEGLTLVCLKC